MFLADLGPISDGTLSTGGVGAFVLGVAALMLKSFRQTNKDREAYQQLFVADAGKRLEAMQAAAAKAEEARDSAQGKLEEVRQVADQSIAAAEARAREQADLAEKAQRQYVLAKRALRDCQDERKELTVSVTSLQARVALLSTERADVADLKTEVAAMRATVAALTAPARRADDAPEEHHIADRTPPPMKETS
jgi:hypothetical protein